MSKSPEQIVRDFCEALERKDFEALKAAVTDDIVYANVPVPPMHGRDAMIAFLSVNLPRCDAFEGRIVSIGTSADGKTVLMERKDALLIGGKRVEAGVMGVMELRGGKICAWRDYFDIASFTQKMRDVGFDAGPGIAERY